MSTEDDDAFWLTEADPAVDICDASLTVDACLEVIVTEVIEHVSLYEARVVDLGCGVGRLSNPLQIMYPTARIVGVDISAKFLSAARLEARRLRLDLPYILLKGASSLDDIRLIRHSDIVYSMAVFQHIDNARKRAYIEQIGRVLRPGGVAVFQYVEGVHSSRCMYDALIGDVRDWCEDAGLTVHRVQHDLLMPRWTWVTATRETS